MGIFFRESDEEYQAMFRLLFSLRPLVCSLGAIKDGEKSGETKLSKQELYFYLPQNSTTPEEVEEYFSRTSAFRAKWKIDEDTGQNMVF